MILKLCLLLKYLDFGIVLIDCHFVKFKSLFVTVKYVNYESLRLPWLNTKWSWVVSSIVDCHSHIQVALFCLLPIFTVRVSIDCWGDREEEIGECIIMWLIWWWAGLWSYIPPMTKINQNNLKQSTDIFTWEQHETKSFSNCPSIESVRNSHLSQIKMCDYDLIIEFSCRCDRVHDICNLNHVLIRNVHWLQRAGDEESDKKSEQQEAWCPLELAPGEQARTIHYRAMARITHHQPQPPGHPGGRQLWSSRHMQHIITSSLPPDFEQGMKILHVGLFGNSLKVLLFMTAHKYDYGNLSRALLV